MKGVIAACAVMVLGACNQAPDGYRFEQKEYERTAPAIRFVVHPSTADLRAKAPAGAKFVGVDLMAWSLIGPDGCEVHVVDPTVAYRPEWIGHEVTHCVWGRWHK